MAEREFVRALIGHLGSPDDLVRVWRALEADAQRRVLCFLVASLEDPDVFVEAESLLVVLLPHCVSDAAREPAVSALRAARETSKFSETRRSAVHVLLQTGLL
eukprot:Amastigsp_a363205_4.p2 type:complete len:103 gc:universal Amastigsp_a363205_4:595-287(-)